MSESDPKPAPLLAWRFDMGDDPRDGVNVVFAYAEDQAEVLAAGLCGGGPNDRNPVKRAPEFDKYATHEGDEPTQEQFWDEGYTVHCRDCDHPLDDEPCWRCADELPESEEQYAPVCHGGNVYCSDECHQREVQFFAEQRAKRAK